MADIVDRETRSRIMAAIRGKDTAPEVAVRKALHARGFRYRTHVTSLPGRPDIVFPRYRAVVLVNGCFWHGHDCDLFRMPATRTEYWAAKIQRNKERDSTVLDRLSAEGWRHLCIWECALKGPGRLGLQSTVERVADWLSAGQGNASLRGHPGS